MSPWSVDAWVNWRIWGLGVTVCWWRGSRLVEVSVGPWHLVVERCASNG